MFRDLTVTIQVDVSDCLVSSDFNQVQIDPFAINVGQVLRDILDGLVDPWGYHRYFGYIDGLLAFFVEGLNPLQRISIHSIQNFNSVRVLKASQSGLHGSFIGFIYEAKFQVAFHGVKIKVLERLARYAYPRVGYESVCYLFQLCYLYLEFDFTRELNLD